jgi:SAM-dependent methyltransferase
MESQFIVNIYESRWWRGCGLFKGFAGLTLDEEMALIRRIANPGDDDVILDLACGTGIYTRAFALGGAHRTVFGLDISWPMLKYATRKAREMGVKNAMFFHGDAHILPFADGSMGGSGIYIILAKRSLLAC